MIKNINEIKHLISGQVDMGKFGLTCHELSKIEKEFLILTNKLEKAKEFINYCKSQPDVYVHANKCLTEIE
jgi:hypothetical protein